MHGARVNQLCHQSVETSCKHKLSAMHDMVERTSELALNWFVKLAIERLVRKSTVINLLSM